jgi:carbamoyltransferase
LVKERAPFRPFAPAVLSHRAEGWFSGIEDQPYMTFTSQVASDRWIRADTAADASIDERLAQPNGEIAAVTHVDGSARAQTVDPDRNPELTALLEAFDALTGCPVLLNTSFNARDEPIVCTPDDALATFRRTGLDLLVVEHVAIERER